MGFFDLIKTSLASLNANRSRSVLTILGIVIGVAAIMLVMSLGAGAQNLILQQLQAIGSKTIAIIPGREPKGPTDFLSAFSDSLKESDLKQLKNPANVPHAARVIPMVFGSEVVSYKNDTYQTTIFGFTEHYAPLYDLYPSQGQNFTADDVESSSSVIVIGSKVKEELFGNNEAVGEKLRIKGTTLRVVGVLPKKGGASFINFDNAILVPYTTAQNYIFGIKYFNRIIVETDEEINVPVTEIDIISTLRNAHNITDPDKDDFFLETQAGAMETVSAITSVMTLFVAAVAAISLLVGGVGIMNIMLVSVTERTREIGLRKAVGATDRDIMRQFLLEAMTLTTLGGALGIIISTLLGLIISVVLSKALNATWTYTFPVVAMIIGLFVAAGIGIIFGLYPARRAARLDPVEALRYE